VAYNFQTGKKKIKLLTEYKIITQQVLFDNATLAAFMHGRKYDAIPQNSDCSICVLWFMEANSVIKTQRRYRTQYGKDPPSNNAIRR
jgi:hypothetical protein